MDVWVSPEALTDRALRLRRAAVDADQELEQHAVAAGVPVRALEVLVALDADPAATVRQLAERLVLQSRRIERLLAELQDAALIQAPAPAASGGGRGRRLTDSGRRVVLAVRQAA